MSDFTNFLTDVKAWVLRPDYSDPLVTSFVRMAETTLSQSLRVRESIVVADAVITNGVVPLPVDWVAAEFIRFTGGKPLEYKDNQSFYNADNRGWNWYTILGSNIEFAAPIDQINGLSITMAYYQFVPTFVDGATWLYQKYYNLYLQSCNAAAALYAQEFDRATAIETLASGLVESANNTYLVSKTSGSVLRKIGPRRIG